MYILKSICKLSRHVHFFFKDTQKCLNRLAKATLFCCQNYCSGTCAKFLPKGLGNGLYYNSTNLQNFHLVFPVNSKGSGYVNSLCS